METEFFASCLAGAEQLLSSELKSLGIDRVRPLGGGAAFFCEPQQALRVCLWSRIASRVLMVLGRVNAGDADLLYAGAYGIAWEEALAPGASFAVRAHGTNDQLRNTRFTALKVKDAIVDRMRAKCGERPVVDARAPRAAIDVRVRDNRATVSLDFAGEALNHRAYLAPDEKDDAPLACSIAAGALAFAGWPAMAERGAVLIDPVCGDGIMLVEAALAACDGAPSLGRKRWGFEGWAGFDERGWSELRREAEGRFRDGLARMGGSADPAARDVRPDADRVRFVGASASSPAIATARRHVRFAGLRSVVSVELGDVQGMGELVAAHKALRHARVACVASNLDAQSHAHAAARVLADEAAFAAAANACGDRSTCVAAGAQDLAARFGDIPVKDLRLGKGRTTTAVQLFEGAPANATFVEVPDLAGGAPHKVEVFEQASSQFAARLRKVFKERRKWAAREGVGCYRIYDGDLPDYAVAIDWYAGAGDARGNAYLHIAEYAPPSSIDPGKARRRFKDVLGIAPAVCGVRPDHVFAKTRMREKGGGQYRNAGDRPYVTTVEEDGCLLEVDLSSHLDTGLFLDHRATRRLLRERAAGKRFLNLFAYTGAASVQAAAGGAASTTTVDLSQTYLDWARRNMARNGFSGRDHVFEKADVMRWITQARRDGRRFDLVFVDPPTFSNSKAMGKRTWDVQRDHVELLIGVSRLLAEGGQAVFSCNLRSFKPAFDELAKYGVQLEDITPSTIPEDFARTPKIHRCYIVTRA